MNKEWVYDSMNTEWKFDFVVTGGNANTMADLFDVILAVCELAGFSLGGGYAPVEKEAESGTAQDSDEVQDA